MNHFCANCGGDPDLDRGDGISSLYNPGGGSIRLCEPCFLEEDELIDSVGTNDIPERLKRYVEMIAKYG